MTDVSNNGGVPPCSGVPPSKTRGSGDSGTECQSSSDDGGSCQSTGSADSEQRHPDGRFRPGNTLSRIPKSRVNRATALLSEAKVSPKFRPFHKWMKAYFDRLVRDYRREFGFVSPSTSSVLLTHAQMKAASMWRFADGEKKACVAGFKDASQLGRVAVDLLRQARQLAKEEAEHRAAEETTQWWDGIVTSEPATADDDGSDGDDGEPDDTQPVADTEGQDGAVEGQDNEVENDE